MTYRVGDRWLPEVGQKVERITHYQTARYGTVVGYSKDGKQVRVHWEYTSNVDSRSLRPLEK